MMRTRSCWVGVVVGMVWAMSVQAAPSRHTTHCLKVGEGDPLTQYYQAVSAGDGEAIVRLFHPKGYVHGHFDAAAKFGDKPDYFNLSPTDFAQKFLPMLHQVGLTEEESCRIREHTYAGFKVIASEYRYYPPGQKAQAVHGEKVITLDLKTGRITSMNVQDYP